MDDVDGRQYSRIQSSSLYLLQNTKRSSNVLASLLPPFQFSEEHLNKSPIHTPDVRISCSLCDHLHLSGLHRHPLHNLQTQIVSSDC